MRLRTKVLGGICILVVVCILVNQFTDTDVVLLSFDVEIGDSPNDMDALLTLLESHSVTATFFTMGKYADQFPDIVTRMATIGEVACHTDSHPHMGELSYDEQKTELELCITKLKAVLGEDYPVVGFRAPYHSINSDTHTLLSEMEFVYDASHLQNMGLFFPQNKILEIPVSAFGPFFLSDGFLIYIPATKFFFSYLEAKNQETVSILFHPHRAAQYTEYIDRLITFRLSHGAHFMTHLDYANELSNASS